MVTNWAIEWLLTGPRHFRTIKIGVSGDLLVLNYHFVCVCVFFWCPSICQSSKNSLFETRGAKIGFFNFLCFEFHIWNSLFLGLPKHYETRVLAHFRVFCC